jgi:protein O-mannosyl-transferase
VRFTTRHFIPWLLVALTLVLYWPVRNHGFTALDDQEYVSENRQVQAGLTVAGVRWAFTSTVGSNWHPLTWISHMLDTQLFGPAPGSQHLVNVLIHGFNAALVFVVLRSLTGALWRSAVVAALFAAHPLHVESAAWISERKDVLSVAFGLLALRAYQRYVARPGPGGYLLVAALFTLGLLAKPMLVTLPFVFLLLDFWPLGRLRTGARDGVRLLTEKVPLLLVSIAASLVTYSVQDQAQSIMSAERYPSSLRVANAVVSYAAYLGKTLWPQGLAIFYPWLRQDLSAAKIAGCALGLAAITATIGAAARSRPYLATGWLWYLGTLVPVIGFVQAGGQSMADRYTYLPSIGVFLLLTWESHSRAGRLRQYRILSAAAALAIVAALALAARSQIALWRSDATLFEHAVRVTRDNYFAHYGLGHSFVAQGRHREAEAEYREALRIKPRAAIAHFSLGALLLAEGRDEEALQHFAETIRLKPGYADAHYNSGVIHQRRGEFEQAIAAYGQALRGDPGHARAHINLGNLLDRQGRSTLAESHFREAVKADPNLAEGHFSLGRLFLTQSKPEAAAAAFQAALRVREDYPEARSGLGLALAGQGKLSEAAEQFARLLRQDPGNAGACFLMGNILMAQGRFEDAAGYYRQALKSRPDFPEARLNLALAASRLPGGGAPP